MTMTMTLTSRSFLRVKCVTSVVDRALAAAIKAASTKQVYHIGSAESVV